jgi:hypothetical protein
MSHNITEDPIFLKLQFTSQWIDLGILTAKNLKLIREEYSKGEDLNPEHYRWRVFKDFIANNNYIEREKFFLIYELGQNDPDYCMGRAMRFDLIKRLDCPQELIDIAINDSDKTLAKYASKYKSKHI